MAKESQNIEWKESWSDEYLKWICGFANADGGTLVIGKNDSGEIVGVSNAAKLMEDIPNKTRNIMGIIVDVNLKHENGLDYIEIVTEPYSYPVSCKGAYHYSSGNPIQISVYENRVVIWNAGRLPDELSIEQLQRKHSSIPFNPLVASVFFRAGYIEA